MWGKVKDASPINIVFWITSSNGSILVSTNKLRNSNKNVMIVMGKDFNKKILNPR